MGVLQSTAWVLLGVILGTAACLLLVGPPPLHAISASNSATSGIVPLASMTVLALLASTLRGTAGPSHVAH